MGNEPEGDAVEHRAMGSKPYFYRLSYHVYTAGKHLSLSVCEKLIPHKAISNILCADFFPVAIRHYPIPLHPSALSCGSRY